MYSDKLEKFLRYGLALVLVFPLFYSRGFLFPFITAKAYFFYIAVDILFLGYIYLLAQKPVWPAKSRLLLFFTVFVGSKFVLDLFGLKFSASFFGNYERMMGLFTWSHLFLYAWLLAALYRGRDDFHRVLDASVIVGFLVSVYGIFQKLGVYFWPIVKGEERVYATFGNASLLAGYLLFQLFFTVYLLVKKTDYRWRFFYALTLALNLAVLVFTATRGALLALAAAVLCALFFVIRSYPSRRVKLAVAGLVLVAAIFVLAVFYFKNYPWVRNNLTLRRISQISLSDATTRTRLYLWVVAFRASADHPIFGVGENNARVALDRHYDGRLHEDWYDSSHNQFLDELLAHGYVGFLIYLSFLGYLFWRILKIGQKDFWFGLIFSSLFLAYIIQNLFLFDSLPVVVFFIVALSAIILKEDGESVWKFNLNKGLSKVLIAVLFLVLALVLWRGISPMTKVVAANKMLKTNPDKALETLEEVERSVLFGADSMAALLSKNAMIIFDNADRFRPNQLAALMSVVEKFYVRAAEETADFSYFYINLAKIFQVGHGISATYLGRSLELAEKARGLSPGRIDVYFVLAQGYYLQGDYEKAKDVLEESLNLKVRQGEVYYKLAEIEFKKGDPAEAFVDIKKAESYGRVTYFEMWEKYAQILVVREYWADLLTVFLKMDEIRPSNPDIYYNILVTYEKLGDKAKIKEWQAKVDALKTN